MPRVVIIQGASGSGKTTLIKHLLSFAAMEAKNIGIIKSCGHEISIDDDAKKDSFIFQQAGAKKILLHQGQQHTLFSYSEDVSLHDLINSYFSDFDFVFVEGFAASTAFPRIVVMRSTTTPKTLTDKHNLIAVASDVPCISPFSDVPVLDLNNPLSIYNFICANPFSSTRTTLKINGQVVPMNHFVENMLINTILGLVKSIKKDDNEDTRSLQISIHLSPNSKKANS